MYERFFGLADAPFRLTPDPRYLFLSPKHAEALAHLKLGLRESSGFVCITGDVGTGKTTLLRAFLAGLGPETATAYIFNPPLSALELLKTINGELGLFAATRSRKKLVDALNRHLLAQREAGRRSIVIIDEAQALSIDVLEQLRLLSNLETTTEKLLRIVLAGQPQLRALLLHPELVQLNQRITLRWHMGPLSRRETVAYVLHRLRVAAGGDPPPRIFTRPALRLVHRISRGGARPAGARRRSRAAGDAGRRGRTPPGEPRCARQHARRGRRDPRRLARAAARRRRAGGSRARRRRPRPRGPAAGRQREHAAPPRPARGPRAAPPRRRPAARGRAHGHVGGARRPRRRRQPHARRRRLPRPPLVRPGARLLARLRDARAGLRARVARRTRGAAPDAPRPHRRLWREGERAVRPCDRGRRARLPARALPRRRRPRRAADAHRPLCGRRRLPAADARRVVVSSILDALKKLEAAEAPPVQRPAVLRERPRALGLTAAATAPPFR